MVFSSLNFLFLFLPIVLVLYFLSPRKIKNAILLVASLIFYAWGEPVYVVPVSYTHLDGYKRQIFMNSKTKKITTIGMLCALA